MANNKYQNILVSYLLKLAMTCSARVGGPNGDAFTNFDIFFTKESQKISVKNFPDSSDSKLIFLNSQVNNAIIAVTQSGGQETINTLNNLVGELNSFC